MSSYKDYKWQVIASDFNSPFFRNYIWAQSPMAFPKMFDLPIPIMGIVSRENSINYIADIKSWNAAHELMKEKALKDFNFVETLIDDTNSYGESFNLWSEKEIFQADLTKKSSTELLDLLDNFSEKQAKLYSYGITLPILDFLGFSFIERKVDEFLKSKVSGLEYKNYFDIFTYPLHNSFAQDQEEALLKLMGEFYNPEWKKNMEEKYTEEIKMTYPDFYKKLEEHTQKYTWIYYVFAGPAFTDKHFLGFIKDYFYKGIDPRKKLEEMEEKKKEALRLREEAIKKLQPNAEEEFFLRLAAKMVWAKPRRKDYQSRSYYHLEKLHRELARRTFLSLLQIRSAPFETIKNLLKDDTAETSITNTIYKMHVCVPEEGKVKILHGKEAEAFCDNYLEKEVLQEYTNIKEIKGNTASPGKKTGKVRIINRAEDMDKMEEGDILVSVATTPSIVPAMKKAGAIVTDEGGLTCHAAIVSREFGIICVIGTKIATKVFKDGDMVEVDADKGVVRIIEGGLPELGRYEDWVEEGRWFQSVFGNTFFSYWHTTKIVKDVIPELTFDGVFSVDYYFFRYKQDLDSIHAYLKEHYKNNTLNNVVQTLDKYGKEISEKLEKELNKGGKYVEENIEQILSLYKEMVGFWSIETYIGDPLSSLAKEVGYVTSEAELFEKVHSYLRKTWLEAELEEVIDMAKNGPDKGKIEKYIKDYNWINIKKWVGEPITEEYVRKRIKEEEKNLKEGNYSEKKHSTVDETQLDGIIQVGVATAYWRAECGRLANMVAFSARNLLKNIAQKNDIDYKDVPLLSPSEFMAVVKSPSLIIENKERLFERRKEYFSFVDKNNQEVILTPADPEYNLIKKTFIKEADKNARNNVLRGIGASPGKVKGIVRVIEYPQQFDLFQEKEILVTAETTPSFVPLMRKASAIITGKGGITSHAAIVSRELKKPCVIAVKDVIKILKTGDKVEVDADQGIIKIINQNA